MALKDMDIREQPLELRRTDRLTLALIGLGVIFASLGLGEAVYRLAFFEFEGATDRLPIEMLFGMAFAWMSLYYLDEADFQRRVQARKAQTTTQDQH